jgi:hypothetical protein
VSRSNEIGERGEERLRAALQGERVKQSGGGRFWKSDVRDKLRVVWEVKSTDSDGIRITRDMLRKARDAARGMRGTGDRYVPGVAIDFPDKTYVLLELDEYASMVTSALQSDGGHLTPSKAAVRRAATRRSL